MEVTMQAMMNRKEEYQGWYIEVHGSQEMCANFSFTVTAPNGVRQEVKMGGESLERAFERAREWIDMELAMQNDE